MSLGTHGRTIRAIGNKATAVYYVSEIEEALAQTDLAQESYRNALALNPFEKRADKNVQIKV
ncbi:MAG: hypothetical protein ACR2PG_16880 [Hyphomicrobiaceae bacterium]